MTAIIYDESIPHRYFYLPSIREYFVICENYVHEGHPIYVISWVTEAQAIKICKCLNEIIGWESDRKMSGDLNYAGDMVLVSIEWLKAAMALLPNIDDEPDYGDEQSSAG